MPTVLLGSKQQGVLSMIALSVALLYFYFVCCCCLLSVKMSSCVLCFVTCWVLLSVLSLEISKNKK
jgi:uncharacterized membrane protein YoaK (UPF0700 family)